MRINTLSEVFLQELIDVYHAEKQLAEALPKLVKAASCQHLGVAFRNRLAETNLHVERLESIFALLSQKPDAKICNAMAGLIEESGDALTCDCTETVRDALLIADAQNIGHHEIAAYGTLHAWADQLGYEQACGLLKETLEEEKAADKAFTDLAFSHVNHNAETSTIVSE